MPGRWHLRFVRPTAEDRLETLLKAVVVGARVEDPSSRGGGEQASAFVDTGALAPPYDPEAMCLLVEHSNSLRQNVDAYATNIDGFGFRFDPAIDFEAEDARDKVRDALMLERLAARETGTLPAGTNVTPSTDEANARFDELRQHSRVERARLEAFFDFACFVSHQRHRDDLAWRLGQPPLHREVAHAWQVGRYSTNKTRGGVSPQ